MTEGTPAWLTALADQHAEAGDPAAMARLRAQAADDSRATGALDALDATIADLATLRGGVGGPTVPAEVAERLELAFDQPRRVPDPGPHRWRSRGRGRGARHSRRVLITTAAVVVVLVSLLVVPLTDLGDQQVAGTASAQPIDLDAAGDLSVVVRTVIGRTDAGPLTDPRTLADCLEANGVPAGTPLIGSAQVLTGGDPAVLLLLPSGTAGSFDALVVRPQCSAEEAAVAERRTIGGR